MTDFDWQTDEEDGVAFPSSLSPQSPAQRRWPWLIVLVLLATTAYGGLRWRANRQAEAIINDVLTAHSLVQTAVATQDIEKLNLVLSGRELNWQEAQQRLLLTGDFANRPVFGLHTLAANSQPTITLAPDLQEVVVVYDQPYEQAEGEKVVLQQTAVYRPGSHNWLLSPPQDAFWGATVVTYTNYFALTYPQRDEEMVLSLVHDLDELLLTILCGQTVDCFPPQFQLPLHFSVQPQTLLAMNDAANWLRTNDPLTLPTPTLVGLPRDEAGYQALYRGYGARLTTAVMPYAFDYECCSHGLMISAFLTKQASELNVQPWPLSAADYRNILNFTRLPENPDELLNLGLDAPERQLEAFALVDFLIADSNHPARWWLAGLLPAGDLTIYWPLSVRRKDFTTRWLAHIYEQTGYGLSSSAPDSSLAIDAICHEAEGEIYYRYDVGTAVWTKIATVPPLGSETQIWPLPGSEGYLAYQEIRSQSEIEARMTLHYEDDANILMRIVEPMFRPVPHYSFTGQTDPTGRYLVLFDPGPSRYQLRYFLVDFRNCSQGLCPIQVLFGRPVWSPDGQQLLLAERPSPDDNADLETQLQQVVIKRGAGNGKHLTAVSRGFNPHWLDNEHYLYMRLDKAGIPEIVQAAITDDLPHLWLEAADLLPAIPIQLRPSALTITNIVIHSPQQAAILAAGAGDEAATSYLFLWQPTAIPTLVYQSDSPLTMSFSPDGRWLTATAPDGNLTLLNATTGTEQQFHSPQITPDWSADGQWLLTGRENYLLLTMPGNGYQQLVFNDMPACERISWGK